jgi:hypothetical protein
MTDPTFSRDDLVGLIEKISRLQPDLSDQELQLLTSMFALTAEHITPVPAPDPVTRPSTVDELRQQLLEAFVPGIVSNESESGGIGKHHSLFAVPRGIGKHHGLFAVPRGIDWSGQTEPSPAAAEGQPEPEEG